MKTKENIGIPDIESELSKLWASQSTSKETKACLFNLIVYTAEKRRIPYFQEIIRMVIERFPCRVLFIQGSVGKGLRIGVSTETAGKGEQVISCDQITIATSTQNLARVPFIVLPHLIPDLPIYLLWGESPTAENTIFPSLAGLATRFIFDLEYEDHLPQFSKQLLKKMPTSLYDIIDMNWVRISGWRHILMQIFDSQERIDQLTSSKEIKITYNGQHKKKRFQEEAQAIYLQGWLASQLRWKLTSLQSDDKSSRFTYHNKNRKIEVSLFPSPKKGLPPASILAVEIHTANNHHFLIDRERGREQVKVEISSMETCDLPFFLHLPNLQKGLPFVKEIFYTNSSTPYRKVLEIFAQSALECVRSAPPSTRQRRK